MDNSRVKPHLATLSVDVEAKAEGSGVDNSRDRLAARFAEGETSKIRDRLLEFYRSREFRLERLDSSFIDKSLVYDREYEFSPSPIMLIGEAPGEREAAEGRPFCGAAGKNLNLLIESSKLDRKKILITNAFAFRTFEPSPKGVKNRTPNLDEITLGADMLSEEINIVKPSVIILLGGSAEKAVGKIKDRSLANAFKSLPKHEIGEATTETGDKVSIAKSYHPSPLVFNTASKRAKLYEFFSGLYGYCRF